MPGLVCVLIAVVSCIDNASATMLEDDSSSAFSRHLELGLILLCSVCPMSLNYWFHLVQSMTCRCASLNVYGFYLAWPLTRCVCEGAFAPPLVGDSFFFSFSSFLLFLFVFSFFTLTVFLLRFSQIKDTLKCVVSSISMSARTMWAQIHPSLERSHAASSGPKTVPSGILEPESRVPQAGGGLVGLSWGGKTTSSP